MCAWRDLLEREAVEIGYLYGTMPRFSFASSTDFLSSCILCKRSTIIGYLCICTFIMIEQPEQIYRFIVR
jgi:hypothetical protein